MVRQFLPFKIDSSGKTSIGSLDKNVIDWISGWYIAISDVYISSTDGYFSISYTDGYSLYDRFSPPIAGGSDAVDVPTTETYVCPKRASGAVTFSDVFSYPATYSVDNITPANLCYVRMKDKQPCYYRDSDGYYNEMYLLDGYTAQFGAIPNDSRHTFYWVYTDKANKGVFLQVPNGNSGIPFEYNVDIYVPASVNIDKVPWSSGLYQTEEVLKQPAVSTPGTNIDFSKNLYTVSSSSSTWDGGDPIGQIDITNALTNKVILGYWNGQEVSVEIRTRAGTPDSVDIVIDSATAPAAADVYWNGSSFSNPSPLGDLQENDIIRLYLPISS